MSYFTAQIKANSPAESTDVVRCSRFEDIPLERWKDKRGQLVLQFPAYGYEANFLLNKQRVGHMGINRPPLELRPESIELLLMELPKRYEGLATALGYPSAEIKAEVAEAAERNAAIVAEFGVKESSGSWGGPLAMLAGAGILAITKAAKAKQAEIAQPVEVPEEIQV